MRYTLPKATHHKECGILNFNTSHEPGCHWVFYFKDDGMSLYFDSFGQVTPAEIQKYLNTKEEYETGKAMVQRNTYIVQHINTHVCGNLYLFVQYH